MKRLLFVLVLAAVAALTAAPAADAARDNIVSRNTECPPTVPAGSPCFGSVVADNTDIFTGDFSLTVESEVWFNPTLAGSGIYTYFYSLSALSGAADPIGLLTVLGDWLPKDPAENWGVVTSETTAGVWLDPEPASIVYPVGSQVAFFSDSSTTASGGLDPGETITFYTQSRRAPALQVAGAQTAPTLEAEFSSGEAYGPTLLQAPEPASVALFGSAVIGLLVFSARRGRKLAA